MASFRFRLQTVLEYRQSLLEQARMELAVVQQQLNHTEAQLRDVEALRRGVLEAGFASNGTLDMPATLQREEYLASLEAKQASLRERADVLSRHVDKARRQVAEIHQQVDVIERYRERERERWQQEERRRESRAVEALAAQVARQASLGGTP